MLLRLAKVLHARGASSARASSAAAFENTQFTLLLGSLAVLGDAIAGAGVRHSAGLDDDLETKLRFREWLSRLLVAQAGK